jgi:hypothetical protein
MVFGFVFHPHPKKQKQSHSRGNFQEPDRHRRTLFSAIPNGRHLVHHIPSRRRASQVPQVVGDHTACSIGCIIFNTVGRALRRIASRRSLTLIAYDMRMFMSQPTTVFSGQCVFHCFLSPGTIQPQLAVAYGTVGCYLQQQSLSATGWYRSHSIDLAIKIGFGAAATHPPISIIAHDPVQGRRVRISLVSRPSGARLDTYRRLTQKQRVNHRPAACDHKTFGTPRVLVVVQIMHAGGCACAAFLATPLHAHHTMRNAPA